MNETITNIQNQFISNIHHEFENIKTINPHATRLYIFSSTQKIIEPVLSQIISDALKFLAQWKAHGQPLQTDFKLLFSKFLVFSIDESRVQLSGCSIDALFKFMQQIEVHYKLTLLNRFLLDFIEQNTLQSILIHEEPDTFKLLKHNNSLVFNHQINTLTDFKHHWLIPFNQSPYYKLNFYE